MEREQNKKEHEFYKQKIDFFTSMAHEIRTPLSLIIAPLEKLIQTNHWKSEVKEQLTIMDENSTRLLSLTNQLLDFRRMESDVYKIHPEKIEIVSLVHNLFSRFSSISYQKGIKFSISAKISSLEAEADPEALTKILSNLLINAFKFTRTRVEICINKPFIKEEHSFFSISIEDDGIGIPEEDIPHVFEKFYQVSSGTHEYNNLGGNGIGLALAKTLTEKHQGNLSVKSEQNVKTVFTVNIPFVPLETPVIKPDPEQKEAIENKENKQTILIVEDDLSLLVFICNSI
jgi:signal transduction histidine kinase